MSRLDISEELVRESAAQVAPVVEQVTGWELRLDSLNYRVLPKEQGYEAAVLGRLRGAGIPVDDDRPRGLVERLMEYVVEGSLLAAYMPADEELLVVRENVDDSNLDGLRLVVGHELVHRGQHLHHGHLFERVDSAVRSLFRQLEEGEVGIGRMLETLKPIRPVMTLLESHAQYVQNVLMREYYPEAHVESHFDLPYLLMRVFGGAKVAQYTEGLDEVTEAAASGNVEELYRQV
ncbi:MAG: hypothetical protein R6X33_08765 [Candidatus Brocadiia bacterium]